jgi:hypothetical protein
MAAHVRHLTIVGLLLAIAACGNTSTGRAGEIPSETAARSFIDRLVAQAQEGDLEGLCVVAGGGNCDGIATDSGGVAAIPAAPPTIAGTRVIPTRVVDDATLAGGHLFVLCGIDGLGEPYRTETLVSTDNNGDLYAINAVYWSNFDLAVSPFAEVGPGAPSGGDGIDGPGA